MRSTTVTLASAGLALLPTLGLAADGFLDDSETRIRYSQYYWNEDPDDGFGPTRDEWVQGGEISFHSGYAAGLFGLDVGVKAAQALHVGDEANSITNLQADSSVQDPHGIAGMGELYGRLRLIDDEGQHLTAGYGKRTRTRLQYIDNTTRILPAASLGFDVDYRWRNLSLYMTQIEGFNARDSSHFAESLNTFLGEDIDHLRLFGGSLDISPDTRMSAEYAEAEDYLASALVELTHDLPLGDERRLGMTLRHGRQWDAGSLFETEGGGPFAADEDHDARFYDLGVTYHHAPYYLGAHLNTVTGDDYDRPFFSAQGSWNSSANNFYWFGLENETMVKLTAGLDFATWGLPGLSWKGHYAASEHAEGYEDFSRREIQSVLAYRFSGALDGLSLAWLHTEHDTEGTPDGVQRTALKRSSAGIITHHADRLYLTYRYAF